MEKAESEDNFKNFLIPFVKYRLIEYIIRDRAFVIPRHAKRKFPSQVEIDHLCEDENFKELMDHLQLTSQERDVLNLLLSRYKVKEICRILKIGKSTFLGIRRKLKIKFVQRIL